MSTINEEVPPSREVQCETLARWSRESAPEVYFYNHHGKEELTKACSVAGHICLQRTLAGIEYRNWFVGFFPYSSTYGKAVQDYKTIWDLGTQPDFGVEVELGEGPSQTIANIIRTWHDDYARSFATEQIGLVGVSTFTELLGLAKVIDQQNIQRSCHLDPD